MSSAMKRLATQYGTPTLDEDHPLWLINEQIKGLLEGEGASEDHEDVIKFLMQTGLPNDTVERIHRAIVWGDSKVRVEAQEPDYWVRDDGREICKKPFTTDWTPVFKHPAPQPLNSQFLADMKEARQALQTANDMPNGPISDTIWMEGSSSTLFDFMDAAIVAAETAKYGGALVLAASDVEFLAARVRRLCKAFDYKAAEGQSDDFVVGVAGSLIGGILCQIEVAKKAELVAVEQIDEAIRGALGDAYDCISVWEAWSYGTMGPDDFSLVAEDASRVSEIREAVLSVIKHRPCGD